MTATPFPERNDLSVLAELAARIEQLEAHVAIRAVMTDYMRLCDRLDARTPMHELGELFTADAVWTGKGSRYGTAFGSHHGRDAILAMLGAYREPPHFAFNAHYLTSESIHVSVDSARGEWLMLQASTYSTGTSDLRSARLSVEFQRRPRTPAPAPTVSHSTDRAAGPSPSSLAVPTSPAAGSWQISRFETENLFSRPIDRWDDPTPVLVPRPLAAAGDASTPGGA
jgi:hypothetical protein